MSKHKFKKYCCVCRGNVDESIKVIRFPKEESLRKVWMDKLGINTERFKPWMAFCDGHLRADQSNIGRSLKKKNANAPQMSASAPQMQMSASAPQMQMSASSPQMQMSASAPQMKVSAPQINTQAPEMNAARTILTFKSTLMKVNAEPEKHTRCKAKNNVNAEMLREQNQAGGSSNAAPDNNADARELVEVIWDRGSDISSDDENVDMKSTAEVKSDEAQQSIDDENEPNTINVLKNDDNDNTNNAEESIDVDTFIAQHANCPKKCVDNFDKSDIIRFIDESRELDETVDGVNRLNVILLGIIRVLQSQTFAQPNRQRNIEGRKRVAVSYQMHGIPVCREFFLKVHAIGPVRWLNLIKTYKTKGLIEKKHGNCKKKPHHALPLADIDYVAAFLRNFAEQNALVTSGLLDGKKNVLKMLPSCVSKSTVYGKYAAACAAEQRKCVSLCSFRRIWISCCPDVVLQKPYKSDPCDIR